MLLKSILVFVSLICSLHAIGCSSIPTVVGANKKRQQNSVSYRKTIASLPVGIKNGIASGLAAAVAKGVLQPFDTIKTVQQTHKTFAGLGATTTNLIKSRGRLMALI